MPRCRGFRGRHATLVVVLASAFTLLSAPIGLAQEPEAPKKVVSVEGVTEYSLPNGLRVLLFPDPSSARVTVNLTMFVGSRHEGYGETGMAHLLEHMVFKGTPKHPDVPNALKQHGAAFNGTTWVDRTNYFESMPAATDADADANLEFGIRLEADRMVNSFGRAPGRNSPREDLLSEMTVVRNEFERGENSPERVLSQRMTAVAYEWHNYGKSTIGNRTDIERVPIDKLEAFYKKYYRPDNAMLILAGRFDEKKALEFVGKYFGTVKNPPGQVAATYTEEPPQDGEREVTLRRVGTVGVVGAIYHVCARSHEDFAAIEVLDSILTDAPSGRLYQALVESKKATDVGSIAYGFHDPGIIEFSATADKSKSLKDVRDTLLGVVENLAKNPITDAEVKRATRQLLANRERTMKDVNRVGITLSDWGASGDWRLFFLHRDRLEKVTAADVQRVADRYLRRSNRTVGMFFPNDKAEYATVPETPKVETLVKDYKGRKAIVAGENFVPTIENVEARVKRSRLGADGKGLKLALMPKKTRGESVVARITLHYGNDKSLAGHTSASQFIAPLLLRGSKKYNRQELQDELDKLKARVSVNGLLGDLTISIDADRATLPKVLTLLDEVLHEPTFPTTEFDVVKGQLAEGLTQELPEPQPRAIRELRRRLSPYPPVDVRYTPTVEDSISRLEAVTVDEVRKLYADQVGGQHGELALVGDFDPAVITPIVDKIFGDWKAKTPYARITRPADVTIEGARLVIDTPDKKNAVYLAGHSLAMKDTNPDYAALTIGNFLFGGGTLSSRLGNRVRQKEGLSYGVRSMFSADARDAAGRVMVFAITNPGNMVKLDKVIAEEFDKLLKEGVTEAELAEAKKSYLAAQRTARGNDGNLVGLLAGALQDGRTLEYYSDLENKITALTVDQVNQALRKHWVPKKLIIIHGGDFKKKS